MLIVNVRVALVDVNVEEVYTYTFLLCILQTSRPNPKAGATVATVPVDSNFRPTLYSDGRFVDAPPAMVG